MPRVRPLQKLLASDSFKKLVLDTQDQLGSAARKLPKSSKLGPRHSKSVPLRSKPGPSSNELGLSSNEPVPLRSNPGPRHSKSVPLRSKPGPSSNELGLSSNEPVPLRSNPGPRHSKSVPRSSKPGSTGRWPVPRNSKPGSTGRWPVPRGIKGLQRSKPGPSSSKSGPSSSESDPKSSESDSKSGKLVLSSRTGAAIVDYLELRKSIDTAKLRNSKGSPIVSPHVGFYPENVEAENVGQKIHILGDDARSKWIAHALSDVYGSVERIAWGYPSKKYRHLQTLDGDGNVRIEKLAVPDAKKATENSDEHISKLIVSGEKSTEAVQALEVLKHRLDRDSTVCLFSRGLGVLEEVREKIFTEPQLSPTFLLGHMTHRFVFNRDFDAVRETRNGLCFITSGDPGNVILSSPPVFMTPSKLVRQLQGVRGMNAAYTPFDDWFRLKFPSVMFESIVEPVCLLLDVPYSGVLTNAHARRLLNKLLEEILSVVPYLPEFEFTRSMHVLADLEKTKKSMYYAIIRKGNQSSNLVRDVQLGRPVNLDYLNGYFLARAFDMGITMPANKTVVELIRAKQAVVHDKADTDIPYEETSMFPGGDGMREYGPLPKNEAVQ